MNKFYCKHCRKNWYSALSNKVCHICNTIMDNVTHEHFEAPMGNTNKDREML